MNLVLGLLALGGSTIAVWAGITDPEGGVWAGLRNVIAAQPNAKHVSTTSAGFIQSIAAVMPPSSGSGGSATPTAYVAPAGGSSSTPPPPTGSNSYSAITGTWGSGAPTGGGTRAAIVATAREWIGVPYRWGGNTRAGVDCSGLTRAVFGAHGIKLPRVSAAQATKGRKASAAQAQPGDLVAFGAPVHHVGIYIGGGQMIHAPHTGTRVRVEAVRFGGSPVWYRSLA